MMYLNKTLRLIFYNKFIFLILIILAILSVFYALIIANTIGSMDFPYSPTKLFVDKVNPYEYFLYSEDKEKIIGVQYPVYAHATFILFSPFSYFEWNISRISWSILNVFLGILCAYIFLKKKEINKTDSIFLICIFCLSTPFRNCIGNGQISFLILLCYSAYFFNNIYLRSFLSGIGYIKYSFMPILAFTFFFKDGYKQFLISGLFCLIGWIIFSIYLNQNILETLFQPVNVALNGFDDTLTRGDLYTILSNNLNFDNSNVVIFIIFLVTLIFAKNISKTNDKFLIINLMLIVSLFTFGHLIYDYVVLFPTFVYSYKNLNFLRAKISFGIVLYFWFGIRIIERLKMYIYETNVIIPTSFDVILNFLLLIFLYFLNVNLKSNSLIKS